MTRGGRPKDFCCRIAAEERVVEPCCLLVVAVFFAWVQERAGEAAYDTQAGKAHESSRSIQGTFCLSRTGLERAVVTRA